MTKHENERECCQTGRILIEEMRFLLQSSLFLKQRIYRLFWLSVGVNGTVLRHGILLAIQVTIVEGDYPHSPISLDIRQIDFDSPVWHFIYSIGITILLGELYSSSN